MNLSGLFLWPLISIFLLIWAKTKAARYAGVYCFPKWVRTTFHILVSLFLILFLTVEGFILSGFSNNPPPSLDYVIVLGAKVKGTVPTVALTQRIDAAYKYLADNPSTICIASGGQGPGEMISEGECIKFGLISRGISEDRILVEDRSTRTEQNLRYSAEMIQNPDASVGIVSNNFHVFRGKKLAIAIGFHEVHGIPADLLPILLPHYMLREFVSVTFATLAGEISWF